LELLQRRQLQRISELEDALNAANSKIGSLDKTKNKLTADLGKNSSLFN
jgi:hypothetical protein